MNERGIAMPMAMIALLLLTSLMVAFAVLATSEPLIASNQMRSTQARAVAEAGVDTARWALTMGDVSPGTIGSLSDPLPGPVPAPYDGSQFLAMGPGQFKVTVTAGANPNERLIAAVGYVPSAATPQAIKKIQVTVMRVPWLDPPCAVCAGGETPPGLTANVQIGGSASVSAASTGSNYCPGVVPTSAVLSSGTTTTNGTPSIVAPPGGAPSASNVPNSSFTGHILTDAQMTILKGMAKANGTYYQGSQTWTSPMPNGIIFVDTPSGNPLTPSSPSSDLITVDIHGNWTTSQRWTGWLIVAGSIQISGNVTLSGLIYAQNTATLHGTGGGSITGAVISTNRMDTVATSVNLSDIGNAPVYYNCNAVRNGGGSIPQSWFMKPGTYQEIAGS